MSQLQENLKLGLQAVKYAKENVKRSANQHYFKSSSPFQQNKRTDFLLGATRGGSYQAMEYQDGSFAGFEKDDEMAQRRKQLAQLIAMPMDKKEKQKKIDGLMKAWGSQYFWGGNSVMSGTKERPSAWQQKTYDEQMGKIAKTLNIPVKDVKDIFASNDQAEIDFVYKVFITKLTADNARKFGVGNCQEKGENAILYLLDHTPGGQRISLYCLEEEHKGVTGIVTGAGGDHVFGVYGHDAVTNNIGSLGPNAIIEASHPRL